MLHTFHIAVIGTHDAIKDALHDAPQAEALLLRAAMARNEGDVAGAKRLLGRLLGLSSGVHRAMAADMLAPILVMQHENQEVLALADVLKNEGWIASAHAFRALAYADAGNRDAARRNVRLAHAALDDGPDDVVRIRVMQRLARTAFYLDQYEYAVNLALTSAMLSIKLGAWRTAAAAYSIAYTIHYNVTGDFEEASRYAQLFHHAALKSADESIIQTARVAEYDLAVQFADSTRIAQLDRLLKSKPLPEQYIERFPLAFSYSLVRGADSLPTMRTLLHALRDLPNRSRGEWTLCAALIAVSEAAESDDDNARRSIVAAIARLGRTTATDPAYERHYRRLARVSVAVARILLGDDALATRTMEAKESRNGNGERLLPELMQRDKLAEAPAFCRGIARVFAHARLRRNRSNPPADLTPAEFEVLRLLAYGWSAVKIARETKRSVNTVYNHTRAILNKLEASRASEAVARARARGLIS